MSQPLYPGRRVLWMPLTVAWARPSPAVKLCCDDMAKALDFSCPQHSEPFDCADALVIYNEVFDEYGLVVHDGGASYVLIDVCPWCATRLPESARDRWFETVAALGLAEDAQPPGAFLTGEWRRKDQRAS